MNRDCPQRPPVLRRSALRRTLLWSGCLLALAARPLPALQSSEPNPPPPRASRRLVLCLDGTWNSTYSESKRRDGSTVLKPTNVLKLCRAVLPQSAKGEQIAYYEIGVGSLARYPGTSNRLLYVTDKALGGAFGAGFEANIEAALNFLVLNYQPGDQVFIFGFSRGAATARGLTRFLDWAGGLPSKRDAYYLPVLFRQFVLTRGKPFADIRKVANGAQLELLKVEVEFLGVWDTVMALGSRFRSTGASTSPVSHSFYMSDRPARCVKHARQALAVDEQRFDFRPEIWLGTAPDAPDQTLEQRWFPGVHSNIGGGADPDGLANLTFQWMLKELDKELAVDEEYTGHFRGFPAAQIHDSYSVLYRLLDRLRGRYNRGKRQIGQPATAHLSLDPSVIQRIEIDPQKRKDFGKRYRPPNVLQFLACQPDLEAYLKGLGLKGKELELPDDVPPQLDKLRANCGRG